MLNRNKQTNSRPNLSGESSGGDEKEKKGPQEEEEGVVLMTGMSVNSSSAI